MQELISEVTEPVEIVEPEDSGIELSETVKAMVGTLDYQTEVVGRPFYYLGKQIYGSKFQKTVMLVRQVYPSMLNEDGTLATCQGDREFKIHYWTKVRFADEDWTPMGMVTPDTELLDLDNQTPSGQHRGKHFRLRRNQLMAAAEQTGWTIVEA